MSGWFGKSWGASMCHPLNHHATPVGIRCHGCGVPIERDDDGITLMGVDDNGTLSSRVLHIACLAEAITPCPGCENCQPKKAEAKRETDTRLN